MNLNFIFKNWQTYKTVKKQIQWIHFGFAQIQSQFSEHAPSGLLDSTITLLQIRSFKVENAYKILT